MKLCDVGLRKKEGWVEFGMSRDGIVDRNI